MQTTIQTTMGAREWAMILLLSLVWGGSFFFVEVAVSVIPPLTLVTLRVGLATACLWCFVLATGRTIPKSLKVWRAFLFMGLLNNVVPFSLIVWGQTEIASGLAAILNATTPLFTVLVAGVALPDEPFQPRKLLGVAIGFAGAVVMIGPMALEGFGKAGIAQLAILGAALSYACAATYGRRFKDMSVDPVVTATGQVTASMLVLLPIALWIDRPFDTVFQHVSIEIWASVLGLAVLSTALAYVLYFRILASAGAVNLLLVTFLVPVSAIWLGVAILGESLGYGQIAGMALIGVGLLAIDGRFWPNLSVARGKSR